MGWARQPGARTVEGVLREGLRRYRLTLASEPLRLDVASRTDRGVSARANALTLTASLEGPVLLRALNGISADILFTAGAPVAETFRVRHATQRTYRYFEPRHGRHLDRWRAAASLIQGRVDVRSFGRGIPSSVPCWKEVEAVEVRPRSEALVVEVRAPSFVWGMVRKIIGALREVDRGRISLARLEAAVSGKERLTLPLAEPEGLVLWDVQYPALRWEVRWRGPNRHQAAFLLAASEGLWRRMVTLGRIVDLPPRGRRTAP